MQRAATLQSESERLLAGARDLEESIGVSLSARRFEVHRCSRSCYCPKTCNFWALPWLQAADYVSVAVRPPCSCAKYPEPVFRQPVFCAVSSYVMGCSRHSELNLLDWLLTGQQTGADALHWQLRGSAGRHGGRHLW